MTVSETPVLPRLLIGAFLVNFALYGISITLIGATLPEVIRTLGWSYVGAGAVIAAASIGFLSSAFVSGILIRSLGSKSVIVSGLALQAFGLALYGLHPSIGFNFIVVVMITWGEGCTEVVTNSCLLKMDKSGNSRLMNLVHSAFPLGAVLGPLMAGLLLSNGFEWRTAFWGLAAAVVLMSLVFSLLVLDIGPVSRTKTGAPPWWQTLRDFGRGPLLTLLAALSFFYFALEIGVTSWLADFSVNKFDTDAAMGAYALSLFWVGLCVGRLLTSALYKGSNPALVLVTLIFLSIVPLVVALSTTSFLVATIAFLGTGFCLSAVFPVIMVLVGQTFQEQQSMAVGIVSAAGGFGPLTIVFIVAPLASGYGIATGFWIYLLVLVAMAGLALLVREQIHQRENIQASLLAEK